MSLLKEIQNLAVDTNIELITLLRKCKILAARLGNYRFKKWVESELNGYNSRENLPNYRILPVLSKGTFISLFGETRLDNALIPISCLPEEIQESLSNIYFVESTSALESLVKNNSYIFSNWNPEYVAHYGRHIYQNMNCLSAWQEIPKHSVSAILDIVRNKVLTFALEIEAETPGAGEAPLNSNPVSQEKVNQIFNTYIIGDVHNIANSSSNFSQNVEIKSELNEKIFSGLLEAINQSSIDRNVLGQLTTTIEEMRANQGNSSFRTHYLNFMSILADHMQVLGPAVALYLPQLAALLR